MNITIKITQLFLLALMCFIIIDKASAQEKTFEQLVGELNSPTSEIRIGAAWALGELGDSRAVNYLVKALGDRDDTVRFYAIKSLGKLRDNRAIPYLKKALEVEFQPWVMDAAKEAIKLIVN